MNEVVFSPLRRISYFLTGLRVSRRVTAVSILEPTACDAFINRLGYGCSTLLRNYPRVSAGCWSLCAARFLSTEMWPEEFGECCKPDPLLVFWGTETDFPDPQKHLLESEGRILQDKFGKRPAEKFIPRLMRFKTFPNLGLIFFFNSSTSSALRIRQILVRIPQLALNPWGTWAVVTVPSGAAGSFSINGMDLP